MPVFAALLAFAGFFFLRPFIPFPPFPGPDPCKGVSHTVRGICNAYCTVQNCDEEEGSRPVCKQLRFNLMRRTGRYLFPCDISLPATRTPTEPMEVDTPTATVEVETPTATVEVETPTATVEMEPTETPAETETGTPTATETETPTPTFTPIDTFTATSTPEGLAVE